MLKYSDFLSNNLGSSADFQNAHRNADEAIKFLSNGCVPENAGRLQDDLTT